MSGKLELEFIHSRVNVTTINHMINDVKKVRERLKLHFFLSSFIVSNVNKR